MMSKGHKQHVSLAKPVGGVFHAHELAFIGAPCDIIQSLCRSVAQRLSNYQFGFVDADHSEGADKSTFYKSYVDKIAYHQVVFYGENRSYDFRQLFADETMVLVNGNHFKAQKQAVVIHEKKKDSLRRKLDRLTDVQFLILADGQTAIYDFLKDHWPDINQLPIYTIDDVEGVTKAVESLILRSIPAVNGLVLAGGKSVRMGQDKGRIRYHGKPHYAYIADILRTLCDETYISAQDRYLDTDDFIEDTFRDLGPYGGILSAMRKNPAVAWLSVATDIPYIDENTLRQLLVQRDPGKMATCFYNPATDFPEPLITLWEPKAYQRLLYFLSLGHSCPRKVLINSDVHIIELDNAEVLFNANTPEEMKVAMERIGNATK